MKPKNLYKVLGVTPHASHAAIRKEYIARASRAHPDVEGGSQERFTELVAAYETLENSQKRKEHDLALRLAYQKCPSCDGRGEKAIVVGFAPVGYTQCQNCNGGGYV